MLRHKSENIGFLLLVPFLVILGVFTSCTCSHGKYPKVVSSPSPTPDIPKELSLYVLRNQISPSLLEEFERKTGIAVEESNYDSDEDLLAKIQSGTSNFDIVMPSSSIVPLLVDKRLLKELKKEKLPNIANLDPRLLSKAFDPANTFSLPFSWTIAGIAYNMDTYTDPVASWKDLFDNPKVRGKFSLLDDMRETMGAVLKYRGFSINATSSSELEVAKATLLAVKPDVKAFSSIPIDLLGNGDVVMAHMSSQQALQAKRKYGGKIAFVIPSEGAAMSMNNVAILKGAPNLKEAYLFIDYLLELSANSLNIAKLFTGPVVKDLRAVLASDLQLESILFPSDAEMARTEVFQDVGGAASDYERIWSEAKAHD